MLAVMVHYQECTFSGLLIRDLGAVFKNMPMTVAELMLSRALRFLESEGDAVDRAGGATVEGNG
jgi:hypothetical protein